MTARKPRKKPRDWGADRVLCVSPHKATGGHQVAYVQGGKRRTVVRATLDAANAFAAKQQIKLAGPAVAPKARPPVSLKRARQKATWRALLWDMARRIDDDPTDDDLQRAARAVASLAGADAKHGDEEELTARIAQLEEQTSLLMAAQSGPGDAEHQVEAGADRTAGAVYQ